MADNSSVATSEPPVTAAPAQALPSSIDSASRLLSEALSKLVDETVTNGSARKAISRGWTVDAANLSAADLERCLALIDCEISDQMNAILHQSAFQQFEARWRGLQFLVESCDDSHDEGPQSLIKIWDVEWRELSRDLEFSTEFSQSQLFQRVYDQEFGAPGGQPFGLLLGDFEIGQGASGSQSSDLTAMRAVANTAAAAFAPFIAQAHMSLLGLDGARDLQRQIDLRLRFDSPEMRRWRELRTTEEARFLGLIVPRALMRLPYRDDGSIEHGFRFQEDVAATDASQYCWGNGIWAMGGVAIRAYQECGWFADMRGVRRGQRGAGLVEGLPAADYGTDSPNIAVRMPLEVAITDETERELADQGFICLCPNGTQNDAAFYTIPSLAQPVNYSTTDATTNSAISAMLPYVLCVSRFAHTVKVMARDQIGGTSSTAALQNKLSNWIRQFVVEGSSSSAEQRAQYPLGAANVQVDSVDGSGHYNCVMQLEPHMQFDQMSASMTLKTRLEKRR